MFELRCTVRNCTEMLSPQGTALVCRAGHSFDRAKQGYWNLLQPQDRKSKNPGDSDEAVLARHRWLARGYGTGLVEALKPLVAQAPGNVPIIDLGCGEGTFAAALFSAAADRYCGIDLAKRAIRLAARAWPEATWVQANADRFLPAADSSVGCLLSLFGRRPVAEIARVMAPGGICVIAVPGQRDLIELRQQVQQAGHQRSRWETIVEEFQQAGLTFVEHVDWQQQIDLDADAIADALAMTYRAVRHSQRARLSSVRSARVTMAADLILMKSS